MMVNRAARQIDYFSARRMYLCISSYVRETQNSVRIRDIKIIADQRHTKRRIQPLQKHTAGLRLTGCIDAT